MIGADKNIGRTSAASGLFLLYIDSYFWKLVACVLK